MSSHTPEDLRRIMLLLKGKARAGRQVAKSQAKTGFKKGAGVQDIATRAAMSGAHDLLLKGGAAQGVSLPSNPEHLKAVMSYASGIEARRAIRSKGIHPHRGTNPNDDKVLLLLEKLVEAGKLDPGDMTPDRAGELRVMSPKRHHRGDW